MIHPLIVGLDQKFRALLSSAGGNVALTFGLLLIPIVVLMGGGVDVAHGISVKSEMQKAADATALEVCKTAATVTPGQLEQSATSFFDGDFNRPEVKNVAVTAISSGQSSGCKVTVTASANMQTAFLSLIGMSNFAISVDSTATVDSPKLQIALVLDNTGSMNEYGKIAALQTAANQLLNQLESAAQNPGDIQVAIIPFTTDVNIGTSFAGQSWIDWSLFSNSNNEGSYCTSYGSWNGWPCSSTGQGWGGWGMGGSTSQYQSSWGGCVTDRAQDYDTQNAAPTTAQTYFPADPNPPLNGCPAQIMPMGYNWSAMHGLINSMVANGETNLTIGLAWGWQALTGGAPLNDPAPPPGTTQAIIFMTDGLNTADRWYNTFLGTGTQAEIDARTQLVCSNLHATGITVYTIQVDTGNESPASALLQSCASDIGKWFLLTDPSQLVTVFSQIGTDLVQLHLSS